MGAVWQGSEDGRGLRIAIVVSRYNLGITERLLAAAEATLRERGAAWDVAWVPGALELPLVARRLAASGGYDAVLALGCVIRGETAHFEHVAREAAHGLARAADETGVPVINQVLAVYDPAQAAARAGDELNRGREGALAAIAMGTLMRTLREAGL